MHLISSGLAVPRISVSAFLLKLLPWRVEVTFGTRRLDLFLGVFFHYWSASSGILAYGQFQSLLVILICNCQIPPISCIVLSQDRLIAASSRLSRVAAVGVSTS